MAARKRPYRPALGRRAFLGALGALGITPLLPRLEAVAGGDDIPLRLLLVHTPDGTFIDRWRPSGGELDFQLSEILAPLEVMRDEIVVADGLRMTAGGAGEAHAYGMGGLWTGAEVLSGNLFDGGNQAMTGWGSGTSIDQLVADATEGATPYRSLEFGVQTKDPHIVTRMIYGGPEMPIDPEPNPTTMFDKLFSEVGLEQAELAKIRARKRSILDHLGGELDALQTKVSAHDRAKIEAHLDHVRAIEQRLDTSIGACEVPMIGGAIDPDANENFPLVGDIQMKLVAAAFACDLTRVASLQWSAGFSGVRHDWLGWGEQGHHSWSHDASAETSEAADVAIDTWYAERFRDLLLELQKYPEGDGTVLDHTLVVWGREIGFPRGHSMHPIPFVLAGGAGGALPTGRYLDFGDQQHAKLLVSIGRAMGLDIDGIGNIVENSGGLDGLFV
jgi:hypothetical protein